MTESDFLKHSEAIFDHIDDALADSDWDIDCQKNGNVLTLEDDHGEQIIINRHTPNQELWIAAKSGGYHFSLQGKQWLATRDNSEFFEVLNLVLSDLLAEDIIIEPYEF